MIFLYLELVIFFIFQLKKTWSGIPGKVEDFGEQVPWPEPNLRPDLCHRIHSTHSHWLPKQSPRAQVDFGNATKIKKLEKIFSWTGAGLFIATQLTPLPSSWDSVSGQTISSLLLSGQITSYNDPTNKKWKDISQLNNQIQNLVNFFYKPTRFVFFKYPIETHNRYPTQNEKEALFTKLLG